MNRIKVYIADVEALKNPEVYRTCYSKVSCERKEKIDRFYFEKDKRLSLAAELVLQQALGEKGISTWQQHLGVNGKPYIDGIYFNLSHSEDKVMCAVSDWEIGCDVEKVTDIELAISQRFFYGTEHETIMEKVTDEERYDTFFRLWTLKESFMKVTGLGMSLPLDAFRIDLGEDEIKVEQQVDHQAYCFKEYDLRDGYKYAVCTQIPQEMESLVDENPSMLWEEAKLVTFM